MSRKRTFDATLMFDDAKSMASGFTVAGSPITSTNVIDLGSADGDEDHPEEIQVVVDGGDSAGDTATLQIVIQDSANGTSGWATILTAPASTADAANLDGELRYRLPTKRKQYLRLQYTVGTEDFTAGSLHAGVVK